MKIRMFALLSLILVITLFMLGGLMPAVAQSQPLSRTGLPPASGMDTPTFTQATTDTISTDDASSLGSNWVVDYEKGQRIVLMHDGSITSTWEANQKGPQDDGTTTIKPSPDADFSGLTYSLPFGEIELDSVGINGINLSKSSETLPSNLRMGNGTCARQVYTESSDLRTTKTPGGLLTGHLEVTKWPYPSYGRGEKRIYNYTSDAYIEYTDVVIPDFPPGSNVEIYQGFNFSTGNGVATHRLLISTAYGDFTLPWSTDPVWLGPFPADPGITDVHLDADAPWDSQHYWPGLEDFHMLLFAEGEKRPSVIYAFTLSELEQPQLDLPSHNQQLFGESVTLSWQPFAVMDHVSSYVFELSDNKQFIDPLLSVNEPALEISVNMLAPYNQGFTYYWRVRAVSDCAGLEGPWSEVRTFSLLPQSLGTSTLIEPVNDLCVEGTNVAFEWTGSSLANLYRFQIAEEPTFPDDDSTTTWVIELENPYPDDFSLTLQGLPYNSDGYYWRVAYGLNQVWGDFSAVGSFSNQPSCDTAPDITISPTSISLTLPEGESISETLTISNTGTAALDWTMATEPEGETITMDVTVGPKTDGGGSAYYLNGIEQPTLTLVKGNTYHFNLDGDTTTNHPFFFSTDPGGGGGGTFTGEYTDEVSNSRATSGTVTIVVDENTPETLYYYCGNHNGMGNLISVVSWLTAMPASGTVEAADSTTVTVGIDATNLTAGSYTDTLTITSNDPDEASIEVPVELTVSPAFIAGDCNLDQAVDAGDISALVLEIFDGDGGNPLDTPGGTFLGNLGCDANQDGVVDAGDLSCTVLIVFEGPGACTASPTE